MPTYKQDMTATSGNMGGDKRKAYKADKKKYKKEQKNAKKVFKETGFKSYGDPFGPKKSDYKKAYARSVSGGPDVMRKETDVSFKPSADDNENIGRGGKGPKAMSRTGRAKASVMKLKDGLVSRFQGSTPKFGKNELMKPVIESLKPAIAKMGPTMTNVFSLPQSKKKVKTKITKGQKRSYDLRDAHS